MSFVELVVKNLKNFENFVLTGSCPILTRFSRFFWRWLDFLVPLDVWFEFGDVLLIALG